MNVLRETEVGLPKPIPPLGSNRSGFSPARLFADYAFAARLWFLTACVAVGFCLIEPYFIISACRSRERVVVLDGAGTFSVSPLLGFEEAKSLHQSMALWATISLLERNPKDFDYPEILDRIFLSEARHQAERDHDKTSEEFQLKGIHQKPEVSNVEILTTRENQILVTVEGQLIRTGVFEGQSFTESPNFKLSLTLVRNPDMAVNKRYPLGVWKYDYTLN